MFGAVALSGSVAPASAAACSSPYFKGDVFASVGSGTVDVFTLTGVLVCTLDEGVGGRLFPGGSGFDKAGNFYVTNFDAAGIGVSKFNNSGGLVARTFMAPGTQLNPESIRPISAGPFSGSALVGGPSGDSIDQYDTTTEALLKSWSLLGGNDAGGTDWVDLELLSFMTAKGASFAASNLTSDTQGPDFAESRRTSLRCGLSRKGFQGRRPGR